MATRPYSIRSRGLHGLLILLFILVLALVQRLPTSIHAQLDGNFSWPFAVGDTWLYTKKPHDGGVYQPITSAIDLAKNGGVVRAAADGIVEPTNCPYWVMINHGNGWKTGYAHLAAIKVAPNQPVQRGTELGIASKTALCANESSDGDHVHMWFNKDGRDVDVHGLIIGGWQIQADGCLKQLQSTAIKCPGAWITNDGTIGSGVPTPVPPTITPTSIPSTDAKSWVFRNGLQNWYPTKGLTNQRQLTEGVWFNVSANDPQLKSPLMNVPARTNAVGAGCHTKPPYRCWCRCCWLLITLVTTFSLNPRVE